MCIRDRSGHVGDIRMTAGFIYLFAGIAAIPIMRDAGMLIAGSEDATAVIHVVLWPLVIYSVGMLADRIYYWYHIRKHGPQLHKEMNKQ